MRHRSCRSASWLALLLCPASLMGQGQNPCTYVTCAIRLQGSNLLSGREGRKITSFGFLAGPRLRPWMAVSDSADHYVSIVESDYVSGEALSLAGSLLWVGGLLALQGLDDQDQQLVALGANVTGVALFAFGTARVARARNAMQSAVWWYNAALDNALTADAGRPAPPMAMPGTHARAGAALGSVVGAVGGLAATSGLDHTQTAEGLSITLAFTALGALIGHHIGKAIER
jgi:hypothetical protein